MKRKRVKKTEISEVQNIINQVIKEKAKTPEQIIAVMQKKGYGANDAVLNIAKLVVSTKIVNNRIILSDRISEKPLYSYYSTYLKNMAAITNDILYLWYILYKDITADVKENEENKEFMTVMLNKTDLDSVHIVSAPIALKGEIKKGYYQDYSGNFLALNLNNISEEERNKILNLEASKEKFNYGDLPYLIVGNRVACVICSENDTAETVKNLYDGMQILSAENNKIELKEKILPVKNKPKFLSCKLKGERFCPCYMIFPQLINMAALYKIKFDNNELFDFLEDNMIESIAEYPKNLCYWDNLDSFVDFMWVFALTSRKIGEDFKSDLLEWLSVYEKYKPAFQMWGTVQLECQRLLYDFYNSFNTRLKFDKLIHIYNKMTANVNARAALMNDSSYDMVKDFFKFFDNMAFYINRQFTPKCMIAADKVVSSLDDLDKGRITDIDQIKDTGILIYLLSDTPDSEENMWTSYPFILSPGAFLGNIISEGLDNLEDDYIEQLVRNFNNSKDKIDNNNTIMIDEMMDFVGDMDEQISDVITKNIDILYKDMNVEQKKYVTESAIDEAKKNQRFMEQLKKNILTNKFINKNKNPVDISTNKDFLNILEQINKNLNIENNIMNAENNLAVAKIEQNINNLRKEKQQINNLKTNLNKNVPINKNKLISSKKRTGIKTEISKGTIIGNFDFTNSDDLNEIITELETVNNDNEGIFSEDERFTINNEKIPSRVFRYLKTIYLIAASNSGKKPQMIEATRQTLGELINKYKLNQEELQLNTDTYNVKQELNNLFKDSRYNPLYPYVDDKKFKKAVGENKSTRFAEKNE